jgi:hypothetical protein
MKGAARYKELPLKIVGSTKFGRTPTMSSEETYNMIISDGWLVPFGGYKNVKSISPTGVGRGIFTSTTLNRMFAVIDDKAYKIDTSLSFTLIGSLATFTSDVFIAENNAGQVIFSDSQNLYVYKSTDNTFTTLYGGTDVGAGQLGFVPGYITFQDGRFITPDLLTNEWRLSDANNGSTVANWPFDAQHVGAVQTKPNKAVAAVRFPGRGNLLLVFGQIVAEQWTDVGAKLFPYQRSQSINVDYGCINPASIAANENLVAWVALNEQSGPAIMYTNGSEIQRISTDGIDYRISQLTHPEICYGFFVRLVGHLCYVVTWPQDNVTYLYDFNTRQFFTLSNELQQAFIAKRVAFFGNRYFFVSLNDGNLYELGADFSTYDYGNGNVKEIPWIRIPPSLRLPNQDPFITGYFGFKVQQGAFTFTQPANDEEPRIDCSLSVDSGVNYSSNVSQKMRAQGQRMNRVMWYRGGRSNDLTHQFRFHGLSGPFIATDGVIGITS